ncbi:cytochrome c3 family protein [Mucilaginibacter agri]|uniref:Cytochrome c-552/4 domain-containing protein n=1 Tax=Mucilaginibacter agri TaxID=2695265 RepID=A0A966DVK0_9SPHI|nr:cytochrome c3 family protein [Mucilaginibacter agri]NCD71512.1 hypothetical protein [Mucilaginibacter agri]
MKRKNIYRLVAVFVLPLILIFSQCLQENKKTDDPRGNLYAGSASCIKCHKDISQSFLNTAHHFSTRSGELKNIHGSFSKDSSVFAYNDSLKIVIEKQGKRLFQNAYLKGKKIESQPFDIVFGGSKAETYLYWKGSKTYQLPLSYFENLHSWTNSPGYEGDKVDYNRLIGSRCFECHASYIKQKSPESGALHQEPAFDKASLIMGIDCERCHGPGANHVNYHTEFPEEKQAKYIVKFASLSRGQKLDACAVCHSSSKEQFQTSAFGFKMGDTLAKFKDPSFLPEDPNPPTLDVHGNQNGLLATSKCFLKSNMDCSNCHNTHVNESNNMAIYSQRCMACHSEAKHNFCTMAPKLGEVVKNNCIDCHMPLKSSNIISVESSTGKKAIPYMVRTHHIGVYPEETKKIMAFLSQKKIEQN